ncbi:hypothetical protein CLOSTMETH_03410 [[Clostridium] methylpentosum DSM 5476]|uniref:Uncharacterized protein n=1 Tax=[Clostridium] methylpentosum DSM 5476 TaxID=537013 RepID=C0EHR5_9FIRM|nr:hypothetical protein CLOSTMETH_03410 [[Clostridium] methylpentosum DSM 5476]
MRKQQKNTIIGFGKNDSLSTAARRTGRRYFCATCEFCLFQ